MRLFAAIRPPAAVVDHLELALAVPRSGIGAGLRWTPADQLHITVAFFADVPGGAVDDVVAALTQVAADADPLTLSLRGAGSFADRSLWVGVAGDVGRLTALMADGSRLPYADPRDSHRAHLTVARPGRRSHGTDLAGIVHALSLYGGPQWTAAAVDLMSSELGRGRSGGPLHQRLATVPLGGGPGGVGPGGVSPGR